MSLIQAVDFFKSNDSFYLAAHEGPDADGLGAEYALARGLVTLGKKVAVRNSDEAAARYAFIDPRGIIGRIRDDGWAPFPVEDSACAILDTSSRAFIGKAEDELLQKAKATLFIDHHEPPAGIALPDAWIDSAASSTCEMVWAILRELGVSVEEDMATALYAGISYDTGSFIYPKTSVRSFEAAIALVKAGANPTAIHRALRESSTTQSLLLMKASVGTMELRLGNRVALQVLERKAFEDSGALFEDAEDLINIPLRAREVEVSVLFKENGEGTLRCSLRSKGAVNVATIAQYFTGGGHKTAAGFKCAGDLGTTLSRLMELLGLSLANRPLPDIRPARPERMER